MSKSFLNRNSSFCSVPQKSLSAMLSLLFLVASAISSRAQTFTNLVDFNATDGANPYYVYLVQGTDGQLYGTAMTGGNQYGVGTVYKVTTAGTLTQLYTFCALSGCTDGDLPVGGLVMASNGNFYGTNTSNGNVGANDGTIFEITPSGALTTLHTFSGTDGSQPYASMIQGSDGNLYGTTLYGGNLSLCGGNGCGTVFKITSSGKFTSLYSFSGSDGQNPIGKLFQSSNGSFLGTTIEGGVYGHGTVFQITSTGKLTTLYSFCALTSCVDGASPYGGVIQTSTGAIYGTTAYGGANNYGVIFKLAGKTLTPLYNFCSQPGCTDGSVPYAGLIQASDGNFYGTTLSGGADDGGVNDAGTIFELTSGGKFKSLYSFCSQPQCADGFGPYGGGLLQDTNGTFYGTTFQGGNANYYGTIFSLSVGLGPFVQATTGAGKVAAKITILGTNLTGTTAVSFNGTAATFTVASGGASITTTVPSGATTGPIKVTTPTGTLATTSSFKVTPQLKTFSPTSGPVGTVVTITGVSLTQASKVTLNGTSAAFTVNSDTQVTATVPTGATTGKIVITTPGGTASSTTSFTVN